jgi:hypothetical protein
MIWLFTIPLVLQSILILADEVLFHRKRGLPDWEVFGHPLDSLSVAAPLVLTITVPFSSTTLSIYLVLAAFSSVFVTKDEFLHARVCTPAEHWLHSLLFLIHPLVFIAAGWIWYTGSIQWFLALQVVLILCFTLYQLVYWTRKKAVDVPDQQRNLRIVR